MPTSKVYFTDLRTQIGVSQLDKLEKLIRAAGIGDIDFDHKMTAIKIHFGEPGNLTYLRPNYAKRVADVIKSLGGLRSYIACRILTGYGFDCYNFSGGYRFYDAVTNDRCLIAHAADCGKDR